MTIARISTAVCMVILAACASRAMGQAGGGDPQPQYSPAQYPPYQPLQNPAPTVQPRTLAPGESPGGYQPAPQQQNIVPQGPIQQGQYQPLPNQNQPVPQPQNAAPQNAAPQGPAQSSMQPSPPPFVLTPQEQANVDQVLDTWEQHSGNVTTFRCNYLHWVYDPTYVAPKLNDDGTLAEDWYMQSSGEIKYAAPDKGLIEDENVQTHQPDKSPGKFKVVETKYGQHWACDGKTLYAVDHEKKEVHRTKLPPEMQGKFISEGPLPFAFGTKAGPLKARYYIRVCTPKDVEAAGKEIWLDIVPRYQKDLANFIDVEVILRAKDMMPTAIQITHANVQCQAMSSTGLKMVVARQRDVYTFDEKWFTLPNLFYDDFAPHPLGYSVIDEKVPVSSPAAPPAGNSQARRQWPSNNAARPY